VFPKLLRLEVITLLCFKAVVLAAIYWAFIVPAEKPEPDSKAVLAHIFSNPGR
jgi:phage shock protein PspC (stress-responsive transcriptional regulator)